ncbi:MAG TPA: hypothetical protein VGX91_10170 [Candidatus Cybelea sp.]|jgi:hypothetical protein|nr:hypothetical protein [Candidatus Cybelea sp.]
MASQPDLLNSDSFAGGYQISTQSTPQNSKGVSWNQSATISMNGGGTTVSLNNQGDASITRYGQSVSIARGQTMQLGDGESVKCNQDGSLLVTARNGTGGEISTTLSAKGNGVDVDVTAHDVDLGGALVNGSQMQPSPGPSPNPGFPQPNPLPNPVGWPGPFGEPYGFSPPTSPTPPIAYPDY